MQKRIHFIAIGGALMHNLALALNANGYHITGSDDEIYNPSRSRLEQAGLLPDQMGWHPHKITKDIEAIILGMHARVDNPELLKAQELGLKIYSYPEYLYQQSKDKKRLVVGGSHGKTTTTSMIMHVLHYHQIDFDYAVGAQLEGFDLMVRLSDAPLIVIEGDEYLSSPIDRRSKFLHYAPDIAILTGVAWDHINVFPTFEGYCEQFTTFVKSISSHGTLIYYKEDPYLQKIAPFSPATSIAYNTPPYSIQANQTCLDIDYDIAIKEKHIPLQIFGKHNLQNLQAARLACRELGMSDHQILEALQSFSGAAKRLETLAKNNTKAVFKDFAHAPSKVNATVEAVASQYPKRHLVAAVELHTFSSLNKEFLVQYKETMGKADKAIVYYSEHTLQMKKLPPISTDEVKKAFGREDLLVFTNAKAVEKELQKAIEAPNTNLLLMSSGAWGGIDLPQLVEHLLE